MSVPCVRVTAGAPEREVSRCPPVRTGQTSRHLCAGKPTCWRQGASEVPVSAATRAVNQPPLTFRSHRCVTTHPGLPSCGQTHSLSQFLSTTPPPHAIANNASNKVNSVTRSPHASDLRSSRPPPFLRGIPHVAHNKELHPPPPPLREWDAFGIVPEDSEGNFLLPPPPSQTERFTHGLEQVIQPRSAGKAHLRLPVCCVRAAARRQCPAPHADLQLPPRRGQGPRRRRRSRTSAEASAPPQPQRRRERAGLHQRRRSPPRCGGG